MYKLIMMDLDGVVFDTMSSFAKKAAELMNTNYNISIEEANKLYIKTSGIPFRDQLEQIFSGNELNDSVSKKFEDWKIKNIDSFKLMTGVKSFINKLNDNKLITCLSSNNFQENVNHLVKKHNLPFSCASGYITGKSKKGIDHVLSLKKKFDLNDSDIVFIGDSLNDYSIMNNIGIDFISYLSTFEYKDFKQIDNDIPCFNDFEPIGRYVVATD